MRRDRIAKILLAFILAFVFTFGGTAGSIAAEPSDGVESGKQVSVMEAVYDTPGEEPQPPSLVVVDDDFEGKAEGNTFEYDGVEYTYGVDAFSTVQDAVNKVAEGGTVRVAAGTYEESVVIGKTLKLLGAQEGVDPRPSKGGRKGPESIVVNNKTVLTITAHDVEVNGFTFKSTSLDDSNYIVLAVNAEAPRIVYNIVCHEPGGASDDAIKVRRTGSRGAVVSYNYVYDIPYPGDAIGFDTVHGGEISYNEIWNNASANAAIYVYRSEDVVIKHNLVDKTTHNDGIKLGAKDGKDEKRTGGSIIGNIVKNTAQDGISVYMSGVLVEGNEVTGSLSTNGAIYLGQEISDVVIRGNKIHGNGTTGIKIASAVDASTVKVKRNWIHDNRVEIDNLSKETLDASGNWWGESDPVTEKILGPVSYSPWFVNENMTEVKPPMPVFNVDQVKWYEGIQEAIYDAKAGQTIKVSDGVYEEALSIDRKVQIVGVDEPMLKGLKGAVVITGEGASFRGFVMDEYDVGGGGRPVISIEAAHVTVENIDLTSGDPAAQPYEINVTAEGDYARIIGCSITRTFDGGHPAIHVEAGANGVLIENNVIGDPNGDYVIGGIGVGLGDNCSVTLKNNTIYRAWSEGIWFAPVGDNTEVSLERNTVDDYSLGDEGCLAVKFVGNPAKLNGKTDPHEGRLAVLADNPGIASVYMQEMDVLPGESIQAKVNSASPGSTIYVHPGIYQEDVKVSKANICLLGAKAGIPAGPAAPANRRMYGTDVDGEQVEESIIVGKAHFHVVTLEKQGNVLDGFTIRSNVAEGKDAVFLSGSGHEIRNNIIDGLSDDSSEPDGFSSGITSKNFDKMTIENNWISGCRYGMNLDGGPKDQQSKIRYNYVANRRTGVLLQGSLSNGHLIEGNLIESNGTGIVVAQGEHLISHNTILTNGYGIRIYGSERTYGIKIENNTISGNEYGLYLYNDHEAAADNVAHQNKIVGNTVAVTNLHSAPFDATLNYWGEGVDPKDVVGENVKYAPWYLDEAMTVLSNELKLTCTVEGSGSVKVGGEEYNAEDHWPYGKVLKLVAEPASGWRFSRWEGDIGGATATSQEITIVMDGHKTVKAVFTKIPVVIEPGPAPGGPSSGPTLPPVIAPSVTETIEAETGGTVELEDGSAAVVLPPNAVAEDVTVTLAPVTEVTQPTTGMVVIAGKVFEITAETEDGKAVTQFAQPITLTFKLTEEELEEAEVELDDLKVFYWDEKAGAWIALPTRVDPETLTVTAVTDHFMVFAVMAKPGMPALSDIVGHWAEKDVLRLVSLGVVGGYEDGTFRPEAGITREEFAKMVVLAAGLEPDAESELSFADTDEIAEWARGYVSAAVKAGIIQGVGDNRFAPKAPVTRAQAATMIMRSLGQVEASRELTFEDAESIPEWAKAAILGAIEKGIIDGFEDNTFRPDLNCTRAQAAKMLSGLTVVRFED
ncbi:MAG TPA: S-layer homology domain-containing protein [Bacillota bacterium]|nr:S-layer homology domain-containing protein [Bacillota bacterium]